MTTQPTTTAPSIGADTTSRRAKKLGTIGRVVIATAVAVTLAACGSDDDAGSEPTSPADPPGTTEVDVTDPVVTDPAVTDPPTTDDGDHDHGDEPLEITVDGVDYGFENLPESVPAGTKLSFRNTAETELHEMVVFRLPDDNTTPLAELVELPAEELTPILGAPVTVLLQAPGASDVIPAVGDGTIAEPGRYAVMCFIPQGADPAEYLQKAAESEGGPPQGVAGGPPHFVYGMWAELEVTEA